MKTKNIVNIVILIVIILTSVQYVWSFYDAINHYEISFPVKWKLERIGKNCINATNNDGTTMTVIHTIADKAANINNINLDDAKIMGQVLETGGHQQGIDLNLSFTAMTTMSDLKAYEYIFIGKTAKRYTILTIYNHNVYTIMYTAKTNLYDKHFNKALECINSFKINTSKLH